MKKARVLPEPLHAGGNPSAGFISARHPRGQGSFPDGDSQDDPEGETITGQDPEARPSPTARTDE